MTLTMPMPARSAVKPDTHKSMYVLCCVYHGKDVLYDEVEERLLD
jgi:hypothetical protein